MLIIVSVNLFAKVLVDRLYMNSSGDEIPNVNFYAVRPEAIPEFVEITQNNPFTEFTLQFKIIQGHRFWYQSKAHIYDFLLVIKSCTVSEI